MTSPATGVEGQIDEFLRRSLCSIDCGVDPLFDSRVRVLVAAALPGRVRVREIDPQAGGRLDPLMVEHLWPSVKSDAIGERVRRAWVRPANAVNCRFQVS